MKLYMLVLGGVVAAGLFSGARAVLTQTESLVPSTVVSTAKIVQSANAFLATLPEDKRRKVVYAFGDEAQRARWSNLPISSVPRGGLSLREMNADQRGAAMALLRAALSESGYRKVSEIIESEVVLAEGTGGSVYGGDLYFISILGTPSETAPWMLQFGGHHLGVNLTVIGKANVLTPTLTGAHPATFEKGGKTVRPLAEESDRALALVKSLDEGQIKKARLEYRVPDVILGPGKDGKTIVPEGLRGSEMSEDQQKILLEVIAAWAGIVNDEAAAVRMKEIREGLGETWFAWSGPTEGEAGKNISAYYRIQGPKLVIEFAPQGGGNHIHTIYRDPTNDYGRGVSSK